MKPTLVVLTNCNSDGYAKKYFEPLGPNGELLLEYTLYGAIESGFERIIVIACEEIKKIIKQRLEVRFKDKIQMLWADAERQSIYSFKKRIPQKYFDENTYSFWKIKKYLTNPFLVVDARYHYGKRSFDRALRFLSLNSGDFASISIPLGKTLSPYGGVDRTVCLMKKCGLELKKIVALQQIRKINDTISHLNHMDPILSDDIPTSYMYCLNGNFFGAYDGLKKNIKKSSKMPSNKITITNLINYMVERNLVKVKLLMVESNWFGTQFKHERILAKHTIEKMIAHKLYPQNLGQTLPLTQN